MSIMLYGSGTAKQVKKMVGCYKVVLKALIKITSLHLPIIHYLSVAIPIWLKGMKWKVRIQEYM